MTTTAQALEALPEKTAPVQGYTPGIPWSLHLEAYDAYRKKWGAQPALIDLEGRNCRGGFGTSELDEFIPGWRDKVSEIGKLRASMKELSAELSTLRAATASVQADQRAEVERLRSECEALRKDAEQYRRLLRGDWFMISTAPSGAEA